MKRNVPVASASEPRKRSMLEQMVPENSMRGRKRKHGGKNDGSHDAQSLSILNSFRKKLEQAPAETSVTRESHDAQAQTDRNGNVDEVGDDEEAALCDLHFIANCQSCQSWDTHASGDTRAEEEDDDKGWMSHALSFEKDRLGKDLEWKRKNENELVVIDPREKARDILGEQKTKKTARNAADNSRAWDKDRDKGRGLDRRVERV